MRKMVAPGPRPAPRAVSIQAGFMEEVPVAYRRWPRGRQGVQGPGDPLCGRPLDPGEREPRAGSARRRDGGVVRSLGCKFYSNRFTAYGGGGASVGPEPVGRRSRTRGSDRRGPFLDESPLDLRRCKLFAVSVKTVRTVLPPRPAGRGGWAPGYPTSGSRFAVHGSATSSRPCIRGRSGQGRYRPPGTPPAADEVGTAPLRDGDRRPARLQHLTSHPTIQLTIQPSDHEHHSLFADRIDSAEL